MSSKPVTTIDDIMHPAEVKRRERERLDAQLACLDGLIAALEAAKLADSKRPAPAAAVRS